MTVREIAGRHRRGPGRRRRSPRRSTSGSAVVVLSHVAYRSRRARRHGRDHRGWSTTPARWCSGTCRHSVGSVPVELDARRRRPRRRLHVQVPQRRARARRPSSTCAATCRSGCARRSRAGSASATSSRWARATSRPTGIERFGVGHAAGAGDGRGRGRASRLIAEAGIDRLAAQGPRADRARRRARRRAGSPRTASPSPRRGTPPAAASHVTFAHPQAWQLTQALIDRGVVPDFRTPDRVRLGPAPLYTRFVDVWDAMERFREVLAERRLRGLPGRARPGHLTGSGLREDDQVLRRRACPSARWKQVISTSRPGETSQTSAAARQLVLCRSAGCARPCS